MGLSPPPFANCKIPPPMTMWLNSPLKKCWSFSVSLSKWYSRSPFSQREKFLRCLAGDCDCDESAPNPDGFCLSGEKCKVPQCQKIYLDLVVWYWHWYLPNSAKPSKIVRRQCCPPWRAAKKHALCIFSKPLSHSKKNSRKKEIAKSRGLQWCHEKYFWIFNVDCLTWFLIAISISVCFLDNLIYIWHQVHCHVSIRKAVVYNLVTALPRIWFYHCFVDSKSSTKSGNTKPESWIAVFGL